VGFQLVLGGLGVFESCAWIGFMHAIYDNSLGWTSEVDLRVVDWR